MRGKESHGKVRCTSPLRIGRLLLMTHVHAPGYSLALLAWLLWHNRQPGRWKAWKTIAMSVHPTPTVRRTLMIVAVLYRRSPDESQSLTSLVDILKTRPDLADSVSLVIFDNSPRCHDLNISLDCPVIYQHDSANPGLATAYNFALNLAEEKG